MSATNWSLTSGQQEAIKWVAIASMLVDHVGLVLLSGDVEVVARLLGRLALPLFAFLIAYNIERRGVPAERYLLPLSVFALVSQVPYAFALDSGTLNIFVTLLAGVLLIVAAQLGVLWFLVVFGGVLLASSVLGYGVAGAGLVFVMYGALAVGGWAWLPVVAVVGLVNPWPVAVVGLVAGGVVLLIERLPVALARSPGWVFWWFYPGHLAALWGVRFWLWGV